MPRKRMNARERAYSRQRARITRTMNRIMSEGGALVGDILPPIPKRITDASIRRLANITIDKIYAKSEFIIDDEIVKGSVLRAKYKEEKRLERNRKARERYAKRKLYLQEVEEDRKGKAAYEEAKVAAERTAPEDIAVITDDEEYDMMIHNLRMEFKYFPEEVTTYYLSWLDDVIEAFGKETVGKALDKLGDTFTDYVNRYHYDYWSAFENFSNDLAAIIRREFNLSKEQIANLENIMEREM